MVDAIAQVLEVPPLIKEPPAQPITKEQIGIQNIARSIKEIGNEILNDQTYKLDKELKPNNLAWIFNGEKAVPDPSFSALQLKAAIEHGSLGGSRGIKISFRNINREPGLLKRYGEKIEQGLTVEFLQKLGLSDVLPTNQEDWEKLYDNPIIPRPNSPFSTECIVENRDGKRQLIGFTIVPKGAEVLAAA